MDIAVNLVENYLRLTGYLTLSEFEVLAVIQLEESPLAVLRQLQQMCQAQGQLVVDGQLAFGLKPVMLLPQSHRHVASTHLRAKAELMAGD